MLVVASTPLTGCDALCVQVLGGHPPVDRVRAAASCVCETCVRSPDAAWGVAICSNICLVLGFVALENGLVLLGTHCFVRLARAFHCRSRRRLDYFAFSV